MLQAMLLVGVLWTGAWLAVARSSRDLPRARWLTVGVCAAHLASVGVRVLLQARGAWASDATAYHEQGAKLAAGLTHGAVGWSEWLSLLIQRSPVEHGLGGSGATESMLAISAALHLCLAREPLLVALACTALSLAGKAWLVRALAGAKAAGVWSFLAVLAVPSVVWWTSGLLKQSIGMFLLGVVATPAFAGRRALPAAVLGLVGFLLVLPWAAVALLPGLAWVLARRMGVSARASIASASLGLCFAAAMLQVASDVFLPSHVWEQLVIRQQVADEAASAFAVAPWAGVSWPAQAMRLPLALFAGLFRPLPFEHPTLLGTASGLESLLLLLGILAVAWRVGHGARPIRHRPEVTGGLLFAAVLCAEVGMVATNFGTLSRHRAIALPILWFLVASVAESTELQKRARRRPWVGGPVAPSRDP